MEDTLNRKDRIVMKLLHYFITEQNYSPIILQGAEDEIGLENLDKDYRCGEETGINPTVIEPQCHFGVPMKKPLSPEEELEVSRIYQEELKPKCLKLIKMSEKIPLDPRGKLY